MKKIYLSKIAHSSVKKKLIKELEDNFDIDRVFFNINTDTRANMFWAQMAHETGGFRWLRELGGRKYFSKYDGRLDLGNTEPGDGYRFRGRGLIHITGRYNYIKYGEKLGIDLVNNPKLASEPKTAVHIAMEYWEDHGLNKYADDENIKQVTRRINGGYNGLEDRIRYYKILKGDT